ncbi:hypothetical protein MUB16_28805 [Priestia sp. OVL9]|nr:hypothetical protein [Priestia sp. OVL9]
MKYSIELNTELLQNLFVQLHSECDDLFRLIHSFVQKNWQSAGRDWKKQLSI